MNNEHYIRITPDCLFYFTDDTGACGGIDDELYNPNPKLSPSFSFFIPGIHEWTERFARATDFADTTTDPSFDWRSWHIEGLLLAKEVYGMLPRNYNLIYDPPYEDRSGVLGRKVDFSIDRVDEIIDCLRNNQ